MMTPRHGWMLAGLVAAGAACTPDVQTIDRTQPNAIHKSQFAGLWYYQATIVESEPGADGTEGIKGRLDKIRWEITEDQLIGYRSYEFLPYAEGLDDAGRDFFGSPVVAYRILSHFDIQRGYSETTGVQNNVIVENSTDRPWHERQYMRIDWTQNVVGSPTMFAIGFENYPDAWYSGTALTGFYTQGHRDDDPDRPVFTKDYFDVTNNYNVAPSASYCYLMLLYNGVPRCGGVDVKVRLSFKKVDPTDDYESRYYPDNLELTDDSGNAIILDFDGRPCDATRDPADCSPATFPIFEAFGDFRINRVAFDKERAFTRGGRVYLAGRFDLWEDSYNDLDGARLDPKDRQPKPILYYTSVDFPDEMVPYAAKMSESWSQPFDETVAYLQGMKTPEGRGDIAALRQKYGQDFRMFKIVRNACNPENVRSYAETHGLTDVAVEVAGSLADISIGNVERVCAAIQAAELKAGKTLDASETDKEMAFTWQRMGDIRQNFQNYSIQVQGGLWGVAQMSSDPETGEYINAVANYFGKTGDMISQSEVDRLQWLNGELDSYELLRGDVSRRFVAARRQPKNEKISSSAKQALMASDKELASGLGDMLTERRGGSDSERFARMFGGTDIERELLVNDEVLRMMAGPTKYQPGNLVPQGATLADQALFAAGVPNPGEITEEALRQASPVNWGLDMVDNSYMKVFRTLAARAWEPADFFDPNTAGLADKFKGADRDETYQWLRGEMYAAVEGHEVGHSLGLRHNFSASMDPLNYPAEYWEKYWNAPPTPENPNPGPEFKYASIMDYGFDVPQEGIHGIGPYDAAAIRFLYGELMDVWNPAKFVAPDPRKFGSFARRCGHDSIRFDLGTLAYFLDYRTIPRIFNSTPETDENGKPTSTMDRLYAELTARMEANAQQAGDQTQCYLFVADYNWLFREIEKLEPRPELVHGARMLMPVKDLIQQEQSALLNPPEYDDPSTDVNDDPNTANCIEGDESLDCADQDGDLVADDRGFGCRVNAEGKLEGCWENYVQRVNYDFCPDDYAGYSPNCQPWDAGADFLESTENFILRYDRDYFFSNFRRDAYSASGWYRPSSYLSRLEGRTLFHMTNVFRFYLYTRRRALDAPLFDKWAEASYKGINFLERIIQTPEPGTYCLDQAKNLYVPESSVDGACNQPFEVGLGVEQGKFYETSWSNEYYYKGNRYGVFWDKLAAIRQLTSSSGSFIRDYSDLFDRRAFSLGYLRAYEDPIIRRFSALIRGDHTGYRSIVTEDESGEKFVRYMPFFDEENADGSSVRLSLRGKPEIEPSWSWTLQLYALAYAISNFSSINDSAPEFYRFTKVAVEGTPEDVEYPANIPMVSFTDPETLIKYRAPEIPARPRRVLVSDIPVYRRGNSWGIGADLLKEGNRLVTEEYNPARQACPDPEANPSSEDCRRFQRAHKKLREHVGYIDIMRRFNRRAELP